MLVVPTVLQNYYQLNTDSSGHISFATGTNTLQLGTGSSANGNITCNGPSSSISFPYCTGTCISAPSATSANFASASVTVNNINFTYTTAPTYTAGMIGYNYFQTFTPATYSNATIAIVGSFASLPIGVYILNGLVKYTFISGTANGFGCGFSLSSTTYTNSGQLAISNCSSPAPQITSFWINFYDLLGPKYN